MSSQIQINHSQKAFKPGEEISGTVSWNLDRVPQSASLHLIWYTQGKGAEDVEVVKAFPLEFPKYQDSRSFSFRLPESPYSFSGKLISLCWAIELIFDPDLESALTDFTMSPSGKEIHLHAGT